MKWITIIRRTSSSCSSSPSSCGSRCSSSPSSCGSSSSSSSSSRQGRKNMVVRQQTINIIKKNVPFYYYCKLWLLFIVVVVGIAVVVPSSSSSLSQHYSFVVHGFSPLQKMTSLSTTATTTTTTTAIRNGILQNNNHQQKGHHQQQQQQQWFQSSSSRLVDAFPLLVRNIHNNNQAVAINNIRFHIQQQYYYLQQQQQQQLKSSSSLSSRYSNDDSVRRRSTTTALTERRRRKKTVPTTTTTATTVPYLFASDAQRSCVMGVTVPYLFASEIHRTCSNTNNTYFTSSHNVVCSSYLNVIEQLRNNNINNNNNNNNDYLLSSSQFINIIPKTSIEIKEVTKKTKEDAAAGIEKIINPNKKEDEAVVDILFPHILILQYVRSFSKVLLNIVFHQQQEEQEQRMIGRQKRMGGFGKNKKQEEEEEEEELGTANSKGRSQKRKRKRISWWTDHPIFQRLSSWAFEVCATCTAGDKNNKNATTTTTTTSATTTTPLRAMITNNNNDHNKSIVNMKQQQQLSLTTNHHQNYHPHHHDYNDNDDDDDDDDTLCSIRIDRTQVYAGILLVHLQLAPYLGVAACHPPSRKQVDEMFTKADLNDVGTIGRDEFTEILILSFTHISSRILVYYGILLIGLPLVAKRLFHVLIPIQTMLSSMIRPIIVSFPASATATSSSILNIGPINILQLIQSFMYIIGIIIERILTVGIFVIIVPIVFRYIDKYSERLLKPQKLKKKEKKRLLKEQNNNNNNNSNINNNNNNQQQQQNRKNRWKVWKKFGGDYVDESIQSFDDIS